MLEVANVSHIAKQDPGTCRNRWPRNSTILKHNRRMADKNINGTDRQIKFYDVQKNIH